MCPISPLRLIDCLPVMPTLNWIGKAAVVKHHKDVPFRLLEPVPELSCGAADSGNLIVQGDNPTPCRHAAGGIPKDEPIAGGDGIDGLVYDVSRKIDGPKVIYAAAKRMGSRAVREGITFKQTPYALEV